MCSQGGQLQCVGRLAEQHAAFHVRKQHPRGGGRGASHEGLWKSQM